MRDLWFISDTHFGHENILTFRDADGSHFRGKVFSSVTEMDNCMVQNWNSLVKPTDKIYHLGDVGYCNNKHLDSVLSKLHGHKRLILGNHDKIKRNSPLLRHFDKIMMWWPFDGILFSHLPLKNIPWRCVCNVHGHIHNNPTENDGKHINICVEVTDYKPIHYDEIKNLAMKLIGSNI